MKEIKLLILFIGSLFSVNAQIFDDFSDGNISNNPTWRGNTQSFIVNAASELQLSTSGSGNAELFLPYQLPDSTIWEIYTRLDFAPSTSNQLRIYLLSNDSTLNQSNGYYLEIGQSGSDDAILFYRQDGSSDTLLASGNSGAVGSEPAIARIQVTRKEGGIWRLATDYSGGSVFSQEFELNENTYSFNDAYFGISCKFSASRSDKFFFDDIKVTALLPDIEAPELLQVSALSSNSLELVFSEEINENSILDKSIFEVNNGIGTPDTAFFTDISKSTIQLNFTNEFISDQNYEIRIDSISDALDNIRLNLMSSFVWVNVQSANPFDILINEIMADPSRDGGATLGLPNQEFVELYNRSDKIIDLSDLVFEDASLSVPLPRFLLYPDSYVILYEANLESFGAYGDTLALTRFPALTNSGEQLSLVTTRGELIHTVDFDISWYRDGNKAEGAWTLELVNPEAICTPGISNWVASTHPNGGTPGQANSVLDEQADLQGPILQKVFPSQADQLTVFFNEAVSSEFDQIDLYDIDGFTITSAEPTPPLYQTVELTVTPSFQLGEVYQLDVSANLEDCIGNIGLQNQSIQFGLPEEAEAGDLVLNEILYYPETRGSRFVELFNRSDKTLNIASLIIARRSITGFIEDAEPIQTDYLLLPDSFCVLSPNPLDISERYFIANPAAMLSNTLPAYDNQEDQVVLYRPDPLGEIIIDELAYDRDFPYQLLDDLRGVSLERINPFTATQSLDNWHSAASDVGFATPTYRNSQFNSSQNNGSLIFSIEEKKVSPDNDGYQDVLLINYKTEEAGFSAKVDIFDSQGRHIRQLVRNVLLGTSGNIKWDGLNDVGERLPIGVYIIRIEATSPNGSLKMRKFSCIVTYPLE